MNQKYKILPYHVALILVLFAAVIIRLVTQYAQELIPGINGGYYPLLARNILESGTTNYPDAPLIHYFNALVSSVISWFSGNQGDHAVMTAARLTDSLIPPLVMFPVFIHARKVLQDRSQDWSALLLASFASLYLIPLMVMAGDLTKNSIAMVFLAAFMERTIRWISGRSIKTAVAALLFLVLTGLTHIGSLAVAFLFIVLAGLFNLPSRRKPLIRSLLFLVIFILLFLLGTYFLLLDDPARMERVFSLYLNPLRIFESPYLFLLFDGQMPFTSFLLHNLIIVNLLSISGLILLSKFRKNLDQEERRAAWIFTVLSLILSSPLIGIEWALRYHMMAWLPVTFQFAYIFKIVSTKKTRSVLGGLFAVLVIFSVVAGFTGQRRSSITAESLEDLSKISSTVHLHQDDLVVARHGLEWWAGWALHVKTGKEYCLKPEDWNKYPAIFLLKQKKGNNFLANPGTNQFAELPYPADPDLIYSSEYFDLIRLREPKPGEYSPGILPLIQGTISSTGINSITLRLPHFEQEVIIPADANFIECSRDSLIAGKRADIWGSRKPFSIKIHADVVRAY